MKYLHKVVVSLLLAALLLPSGTALAYHNEGPAQSGSTQQTEEDLQLATARVTADLVRPGRVLMSARGNHWIYDSVPPINGPNEEVNPLDGMLASLIACGMYIYEAVGIEQEIEVSSLSATVQGELDPRGATGADVNPRLRAFHVIMNIDGPTAEEAAMMTEAFSQRCPIYTTLALSAPIDVTNVVDGVEQDAIATEADPIVDHDEAEGTELNLAMPSASGRMVEFGRSLMSARGNHWIYDSVPPINGPNEEVNPLDALVGALPACGLMIYEAVAREQDIPLHFAKATVEADLDPRGVAGADVNPRIRAFRVNMQVSGPTAAEAEMMAEQYSTRCPIYTTFERSAPIEVSHTYVTEDGNMIREINFEFGTHPQLGFPEQHVLVQQEDLDTDMGMRLEGEQTADEENLERDIFAAAEDIGHDPFSLGEDPLGPFPVGESLDMTLGDWLAAEGNGTYRVVGDHGEISIRLQNMVPNGVYTLWCTRITVPPDFLMLNKACGPEDGSTNAFTADEEGSIEFSMDTWALEDTSAETVSVLAVAYHSDDNTYGASPGTFGLNSHVQIFTMLPPFADEAWQVIPANEVIMGIMDEGEDNQSPDDTAEE